MPELRMVTRSYLEAYFSMRQIWISHFELFKYTNGPFFFFFFFKVQAYERSGFSDFSIQIYTIWPVDTPPSPEAWVLNTNFVYHFCMLIP